MLNKIVKILGWAVLAITAVMAMVFFLKDAPVLQAGLDEIQDMPQELKPAEIAVMSQDWSATVFNWGLFLFFASAAIAIIFAIYHFVMKVVDNPKSAIKTGISIVFLGLVVLVAYSLSSETIPVFLGADNFDITPATSKMVETFIYTMYILVGMTVLGLIYSEVSRIWR